MSLTGTQALEQADWSRAREAFEAELAAAESPDAQHGLGQALWFLGEVKAAIAAREAAFDGYARAGRCDDAARAAVWVSHQHALVGRASAARGWLARAERALSDEADGRGAGWVAAERARQAPVAAEKVALAERALEIARATRTEDLEVFALSLLGRARIGSDPDAGMALLEEAMAAATAGRVRDLHVLAEAYCNLIEACTRVGEWERATEWCGLVDEFADTHGLVPLFGACRMIHADVLIATGRWPEGEASLQEALATHARHIPEMGAPAVASLAVLRVRQGRLREAETLLAGREEHPSSLRALGLLRIAEGHPRVAVTLLERGLRGTEGDAVSATQLLAPLVDARLACGDRDGAAAAAERLAALAAESRIRLVAARADLAAARLALAANDPAAATEPARRALAAFGSLSMPLDAGEARLELARGYAAGDPEVAAEEAHAAFAAFKALGAARAMDAAAAVLRELGAATGGRGRAAGDLTAREREVLDLVALGMSNARIAQTLVISEKTAGHHVSRILMKLGAANRTEAVARSR